MPLAIVTLDAWQQLARSSRFPRTSNQNLTCGVDEETGAGHDCPTPASFTRGDRRERPPRGAESLALWLLPIARASRLSVVPAADRTSALPFTLVALYNSTLLMCRRRYTPRQRQKEKWGDRFPSTALIELPSLHCLRRPRRSGNDATAYRPRPFTSSSDTPMPLHPWWPGIEPIVSYRNPQTAA